MSQVTSPFSKTIQVHVQFSLADPSSPKLFLQDATPEAHEQGGGYLPSLSSPPVQHVKHADDDPEGEAGTISAALPKHPVAKSPQKTKENSQSKESSGQAKESCRQSQEKW